MNKMTKQAGPTLTKPFLQRHVFAADADEQIVREDDLGFGRRLGFVASAFLGEDGLGQASRRVGLIVVLGQDITSAASATAS